MTVQTVVVWCHGLSRLYTLFRQRQWSGHVSERVLVLPGELGNGIAEVGEGKAEGLTTNLGRGQGEGAEEEEDWGEGDEK